MTDGCEGPTPSARRPFATALTDIALRAIAIGWNGYVGTTAVPSSRRVVAPAATVNATKASRLHGRYGNQPLASPAPSAHWANVAISSTVDRWPPVSLRNIPIFIARLPRVGRPSGHRTLGGILRARTEGPDARDHACERGARARHVVDGARAHDLEDVTRPLAVGLVGRHEGDQLSDLDARCAG